MLSMDAITGFLYYVLLTLGLVFNFQPLVFLGLFMFRYFLQLIIYIKLFKRLDGKGLLWFLPLMDMFYYIFIIIFGLMGTSTKTKQWK